MQQWLRSSKFLLIFLPIWLFVLSWIRPLSDQMKVAMEILAVPCSNLETG